MSNCVVASCPNRSMKNPNLSFHENVISGCKIQKQPPEVFYKKSFLKNFCNIHRKMSVLESVF